MIWKEINSAFLDIWSIEHIVSGILLWIILSFVIDFIFDKYLVGWEKKILKKYPWFHKKTKRLLEIFWILFVVYFWETLEHYCEVWLLWEYVRNIVWVEYWINRIVSDPLLALFWFFIYTKFHRVNYFITFFLVIWFIAHIIILFYNIY